jgi:hypothetical protein
VNWFAFSTPGKASCSGRYNDTRTDYRKESSDYFGILKEKVSAVLN